MKPAILSDPERRDEVRKPVRRRNLLNNAFVTFCAIVALLSLIILVTLLATIFSEGLTQLDWRFLKTPSDSKAESSGILSALFGTLLVCGMCALFTLPLGVATAVFLEEYQPRARWLKRLRGFIQLNISNLAGVPSIVYGILGLTVFVQMFGILGTSEEPAFEVGVTFYYQYFNEVRSVIRVPVDSASAPPPKLTTDTQAETADGRAVSLNVIGEDAAYPDDDELAARTLRVDAEGGLLRERSWYYFRLPFGRSILAMSLTLMLVVLPILITSAQEALRAVPYSLREGAFGLGATKWQSIRSITLPAAIPGIMTGSIISMSRAIGEAAPIVIISGVVYSTVLPDNLMSDSTVLPLQIYYWLGLPNDPESTVQYQELAASGIIVLLGVLLLFNLVAVVLRQRFQRPLS